MDLQVLPLHRYPEYTMECCQLINDEWKRSETARLRSLQSSCDYLPACLILVQKGKVIGHAKLSSIPSIKDACFVESVVISKSLRGKGFGTHLMLKTEEYCKDILKLHTVFLSTKGQEKFYAKLGYEECEPISIYGTPNYNSVIKQNCPASIKHVNSAVNIPKAPPLPTAVPTEVVQTKTFMYKSLS